MDGDNRNKIHDEPSLAGALASGDEAYQEPIDDLNTDPGFVFVYGTLKRGFSNPMSAYLLSNAKYHGSAIMAGQLYDLGPYPGLILSNEGHVVHGELYKIAKPNTLLALLDAYEGCGPDDNPPYDFIRISVTVRDEQGTDLRAWVYLYQGSFEEATLIPEGQYLKAVGA